MPTILATNDAVGGCAARLIRREGGAVTGRSSSASCLSAEGVASGFDGSRERRSGSALKGQVRSWRVDNLDPDVMAQSVLSATELSC